MSTSDTRARRMLAVGLTAAVAVLPACTSVEAGSSAGAGVARRVIFVSGDGMGATHREAARLDQVGHEAPLAMGPMPVSGAQTTDSMDP